MTKETEQTNYSDFELSEYLEALRHGYAYGGALTKKQYIDTAVKLGVPICGGSVEFKEEYTDFEVSTYLHALRRMVEFGIIEHWQYRDGMRALGVPLDAESE